MIFPYNTLLGSEEICNLEVERSKLKIACAQSGRVVIFGKRNTGKTSVVENDITPFFRKKFPKNFVLSCDLLGVGSLEDITSRMANAFTRGFTESFPTKAKMQKMVDVIKSVSPSLNMKPDGSFELSVANWSLQKNPSNLISLFKQIENIANSDTKVFIVLDEFQDVHFVKGAEANLRSCFERLPSSVAIFLLGSKKHLLSKIVAREKAPLYQWGQSVEFGNIEYKAFFEYMIPRFQKANLSITEENSKELQDLMQRNPESINMLCEEIVTNFLNCEITKITITTAIKSLLRSKRSFFEERLVTMTQGEAEVLKAMANEGCITYPSGKEFLTKLSISKAAVSKIIIRFLDQATIYKDPDGYRLADPLLSVYLKNYR